MDFENDYQNLQEGLTSQPEPSFGFCLGRAARLLRAARSFVFFGCLASLGAFGAKPALASPPAKTWLARVPQIELKLKQAMGEYKKAQVAQAKRLLDDAYFGVFENVKANMEVAIRREIGLKRVSEIEGNIGEIRRGFSKGEDSAKIEAVLRELMTQIKESASELDAQKVAVK